MLDPSVFDPSNAIKKAKKEMKQKMIWPWHTLLWLFVINTSRIMQISVSLLTGQMDWQGNCWKS